MIACIDGGPLVDHSLTSLLVLIAIGVFAWLLPRIIAKFAAKKIKNLRKVMMVEELKIETVSPADFPWLDHAYYDSVTRWMTCAGYRCLGDYMSLDAVRVSRASRTFIRSFISPDGVIGAGCYHFVARGWLGFVMRLLVRDGSNDQKICEFNTEFTGNVFLETSNAASIRHLAPIPNFHRLFLPREATPDQILKLHLSTLQKLVEQHHFEPVIMRSFADVIASGNRAQALKTEYRRKHGYLAAAELRAQNGSNETTEMLIKELNRLDAEEQKEKSVGAVGSDRSDGSSSTSSRP